MPHYQMIFEIGPGAKLEFFPPGLVANDIAEVIKARYSSAWPTWSLVPKATRKEWLELFEENINLKRPTCMDVLGRTKKKKDERWVGKAEEVAEMVQRRRMEALENGEGTSSSQNSVALLLENAIYLEVVGGRNKKGNVFGLGGLGDQYIKETYGTPFDAQLPTTSHYVQKIANLEDTIVNLKDTVHNLESTIKERDKEIDNKLEDIHATLQLVLDHLGLTLPETFVNTMRTTKSSVHHPDDEDNDDAIGDDYISSAL
ncbi:hypothetical protein RIF29_35394 [Crotalaria pallida]|uniref:Transposase, Ptta/En/Spm, plant n=1 Tax=Crotalaria pallida TaxID=3830 RepID=A0AAN9EFU0_CROPI